jgi:hypothetical protein
MKLARPLDPVEMRVLGSLMEKQQATPDYYPMTVNAILAAANQKSNRDPIMELSEDEVTAALDRLQHQVLVWKVIGSRSVHWKHNADGPWELDAPAKALITLLLLRGAQTPGELRGRSERLITFGTPAEAEEVLQRLAAEEEPLVVELPRQPGQKERRWMHCIGGAPEVPQQAARPVYAPEARPSELVGRLAALEEQVERLSTELRDLKTQLGI